MPINDYRDISKKHVAQAILTKQQAGVFKPSDIRKYIQDNNRALWNVASTYISSHIRHLLNQMIDDGILEIPQQRQRNNRRHNILDIERLKGIINNGENTNKIHGHVEIPNIRNGTDNLIEIRNLIAQQQEDIEKINQVILKISVILNKYNKAVNSNDSDPE